MLRMSDIGEAGLLERLAWRFRRGGPGVVHGIGDDAAVLRAIGPGAVVSTDMLVEGVDFDFEWASHKDVGHKAAAVSLSDMAAMGAEPRGLLLSLAVRPTDLVEDIEGLIHSLARVGDKYDAPLVGGDLSRTTGPLVVAVTALGEAPVRQVMRRNLGRVGDIVLVSGTLGAAGAGLRLLMEGHPKASVLTRRQLRPTPQIELGQALAESKAVVSCADVSDGLASDCLLLAQPGCGVEIDPAKLPMTRGVASVCERFDLPAWQLALTGGEDFELVLAVRPGAVGTVEAVGKELGVRLTQVGRICPGEGLHLKGGVRLDEPLGFDHFRL